MPLLHGEPVLVKTAKLPQNQTTSSEMMSIALSLVLGSDTLSGKFYFLAMNNWEEKTKREATSLGTLGGGGGGGGADGGYQS